MRKITLLMIVFLVGCQNTKPLVIPKDGINTQYRPIKQRTLESLDEYEFIYHHDDETIAVFLPPIIGTKHHSSGSFIPVAVPGGFWVGAVANVIGASIHAGITSNATQDKAESNKQKRLPSNEEDEAAMLAVNKSGLKSGQFLYRDATKSTYAFLRKEFSDSNITNLLFDATSKQMFNLGIEPPQSTRLITESFSPISYMKANPKKTSVWLQPEFVFSGDRTQLLVVLKLSIINRHASTERGDHDTVRNVVPDSSVTLMYQSMKYLEKSVENDMNLLNDQNVDYPQLFNDALSRIPDLIPFAFSMALNEVPMSNEYALVSLASPYKDTPPEEHKAALLEAGSERSIYFISSGLIVDINNGDTKAIQ